MAAAAKPAGVWSAPTDTVSLDFAYEGRPRLCAMADGTCGSSTTPSRRGAGTSGTKPFATIKDGRPVSPSAPGDLIDKYPTAAVQGTPLWVFWSSLRRGEAQSWQINHRTACQRRMVCDRATALYQSRRVAPAALGGGRHRGGLWLFWLELTGTAVAVEIQPA